MLSFLFTDVEDTVLEITDVVSLSIDKEQGVPCDEMVAIFPYFSTKELKSVIVKDGDTTIFSGVVDEQKTSKTADGMFVTVVCRSLLALLVDNESLPVSYNHPSVNVIAHRHIEPYGIKVDGSNDTYFGVQTVYKGYSDYKAVEDFVKNVYHSVPYVDENGVMRFQFSDDAVCEFSDKAKGIEYSSFCENVKRCEEISQVNVKVTNSCGYNSVIENNDAITRGIIRQRYINSVLTDTPADCAQKMIEKGREKAYTITLICAGRHLDVFMKNAKVSDSVYGDISNLYVCAARYRLDNKKDVTTVTLKRKDVKVVAE